MNFDEWLRNAMQASGVSRADLIRQMSKPGQSDQRQNVSLWLKGTRAPRYDKCQRLAKILNVPLDDVLAAAGHLDEDPLVLPVGHPALDPNMSADGFAGVSLIAELGSLSPNELRMVRALVAALREQRGGGVGDEPTS
jgi:transcriptional regulator with XRE-family HTH domain